MNNRYYCRSGITSWPQSLNDGQMHVQFLNQMVYMTLAEKQVKSNKFFKVLSIILFSIERFEVGQNVFNLIVNVNTTIQPNFVTMILNWYNEIDKMEEFDPKEYVTNKYI